MLTFFSFTLQRRNESGSKCSINSNYFTSYRLPNSVIPWWDEKHDIIAQAYRPWSCWYETWQHEYGPEIKFPSFSSLKNKENYPFVGRGNWKSMKFIEKLWKHESMKPFDCRWLKKLPFEIVRKPMIDCFRRSLNVCDKTMMNLKISNWNRCDKMQHCNKDCSYEKKNWLYSSFMIVDYNRK